MSPTKPVKATKPKRPKTNPKRSKRDWAVNSGIVISNVLVYVAECASILGVQHAAQAAALVFSTIEVCGGLSSSLY